MCSTERQHMNQIIACSAGWALQLGLPMSQFFCQWLYAVDMLEETNADDGEEGDQATQKRSKASRGTKRKQRAP